MALLSAMNPTDFAAEFEFSPSASLISRERTRRFRPCTGADIRTHAADRPPLRVRPMTGDTGDLKPFLAHVAQGRGLSESQAEAAFDIIMSGNATPSQMGAFLMALRVRGETVDEITGAARIMRAKALTIDAPPGTIDTC